MTYEFSQSTISRKSNEVMRQHIFKIFFQTQNLEQQSGYKADVHLWFKKYRRYKLVSTSILMVWNKKRKRMNMKWKYYQNLVRLNTSFLLYCMHLFSNDISKHNKFLSNSKLSGDVCISTKNITCNIVPFLYLNILTGNFVKYIFLLC